MPQIKVTSKFDNSNLKKGAKDSEKSFKDLADSAKANLAGKAKAAIGVMAAAFAAKVIIDSIKSIISKTVELAESLTEVADKAGLSTSQVKFLSKAFNKDLGAIEGMFSDVREARDRALAGDETEVNAFEKLGVSLQEIKDLNAAQLFDVAALGYKNSTRAGADANAAFAIFGSDIIRQQEKVIAIAGKVEDANDEAFNSQIKSAKSLGGELKELSQGALLGLFEAIGPLIKIFRDNSEEIGRMTENFANLVGFVINGTAEMVSFFSNVLPGLKDINDLISIFFDTQNDGHKRGFENALKNNNFLEKRLDLEKEVLISTKRLAESEAERFEQAERLEKSVSSIFKIKEKREQEEIDRNKEKVEISKEELKFQEDRLKNTQREIELITEKSVAQDGFRISNGETDDEINAQAKKVANLREKELKQIKELDSFKKQFNAKEKKDEADKLALIQKAVDEELKIKKKLQEDLNKLKQDELTKIKEFVTKIKGLDIQDTTNLKQDLNIKEDGSNLDSKVFDFLGEMARNGEGGEDSLSTLSQLTDILAEFKKSGIEISDATKKRIADEVKIAEKEATARIDSNKDLVDQLAAKNNELTINKNGQVVTAQTSVSTPSEVGEDASKQTIKDNILVELKIQTNHLANIDNNLSIGGFSATSN